MEIGFNSQFQHKHYRSLCNAIENCKYSKGPLAIGFFLNRHRFHLVLGSGYPTTSDFISNKGDHWAIPQIPWAVAYPDRRYTLQIDLTVLQKFIKTDGVNKRLMREFNTPSLTS